MVKRSKKMGLTPDKPPATAPDREEARTVYRAMFAPRSAFQEELKDQFGRWLHRTIMKEGLSQSEFARRCGLPRDSISTYVLAKTLPSPASAKKIADYLKMDVEDLLFMPKNGNTQHGPVEEPKVELPSLNIQTLPDRPGHARVKLDRVLKLSSAVKIAEIVEEDGSID